MRKRGQSEVIGNIILVLIGIVAVAILYVVVMNISDLIRKDLNSSNINQIDKKFECINDNECGEYEICIDRNCVEKSESGCYEDFNCKEWSECYATFSLKEIVNNNISLVGVRDRDCFSTRGCLKDKTQTQTCDYRVSVYANNTIWCYENYTEIYDKITNQLVSRVKETEISQRINLSRVDINFPIQTEKEYCGFCFDKVKDFDEEGVDCGGAYCMICERPYSFFDWLFVLIVLIWIIIGILILYSLFYPAMRKRFL